MPSPFGEDNGNEGQVGPGVRERERGREEGARASWAVRLLRARAVEATGPAHWLAWLPPAAFFFFETFLFFFSDFYRIRKEKVLD